MRVSEDAMQDAALALIERGGPATVNNPEAWVRGCARRRQAEFAVALMRERRAWAELAGDGETVSSILEVLRGRENEKKRVQRRMRGIQPRMAKGRQPRSPEAVERNRIRARERARRLRAAK